MEKSKQRYFIKENIIYSAQNKEYEIPPVLEEIHVPTDTKNILTNNKIIITELQKIKNKKGKEFEFTSPIKNFENIKNKVEKIYESKEKEKHFKKPKEDDYDFIEKTSTLLILEELTNNISNSDLNNLKEKINNYINHNKQKEFEKEAHIQEDIEIQEQKIQKIGKEKESYIKENLEELYITLKKLEEEHQNNENIIKKLNKKIEKKPSKNQNIQIEKLKEKLQNLEYKKKNLEMEINIIYTKAKNLKEEMKYGKKKCINPYILILTLGLIYWTKFADCKYKLIRLNKKVNSKKEKQLKIEKKLFNTEKEIHEIISKENKENQEIIKKEQEEIKRKEDLKIKQKEIEKDIKENKKIIEDKEKSLKPYESDIKKIEDKLLDIKTYYEELKKYSTKNITKELKDLEKKREYKIKDIKELKEKIQNQKTKIDEDLMIELN